MESDQKPCVEIPELIEILKPLFRLGEFDEVHKVLASREKNLKLELENLRRERDEKCRLAELRSREAEHERSMLERDLQKKIRRERRGLELEVRVLRDRLMRADEMHSRTLNEQNEWTAKRVGQLVEEVQALKDEKVAADYAMDEMKRKLSKLKQLGVLNSEFLETMKGLEMRLLRSNETNAEMKRKQLIDHRTIRELEVKCSEASETIKQLNRCLLGSGVIVKEIRPNADKNHTEDLSRQTLEALQTVEKPKSQRLKAEADKVSLSNKRSFEILKPVAVKIEVDSADMVLDDSFLCSGGGKHCLDNVGILGAANSDVDSLKRGSENLPSALLIKEEVDAEGKDTKASFQAGKQSGCPPESGILGGKKRKTILGSEDDLFSDDDSCSSSRIHELLSNLRS